MKKLILPYAFRGVSYDFLQLYYPGKLIERGKAISYLGEGTQNQFSRIYTNVLQAIAENDRNYLQNVMEKRLYERTIQGIDQIHQKNMKINYLEDSRTNYEEIYENEDDEQADEQDLNKQNIQNILKQTILTKSQYKEVDMKILLEPHAIFGARINREENKGKSLELRGRMTQRSYFVNFNNLMSLYNNQILSLNVYFQTTRRLFVTDEDGDLVHGEDNLKKEIGHVWRFETYTPDFDWVLTDMDLFLESNPYFGQPPNKEQMEEKQSK